jgi:hypothetical protein
MKCIPQAELIQKSGVLWKKCVNCPNEWYPEREVPECQFNAVADKSEAFDEEIRIEAKESVKLIHNSKGCNWEIKLTDKENIESQLDRLDRINARMAAKYGAK